MSLKIAQIKEKGHAPNIGKEKRAVCKKWRNKALRLQAKNIENPNPILNKYDNYAY